MVLRSEDEAVPSGVTPNSILVAYLVPGADAGLEAGDIRDALRARVPEYMVPSAIVVLEDLPRTPNGKVDRKALPAPTTAARTVEASTPPQSPMEQQLAEIWSAVLHVDSVGIDDNFFEIGGDSISSIQVISRAKTAGVTLKASQLFAHPTIRDLARMLDEPDAGDVFLVPLNPGGSGAPLFIVHGWGGQLFEYLELARQPRCRSAGVRPAGCRARGGR